MKWILERLREIARTDDSTFDFGPDQKADLRFHRPYFLLNLPTREDNAPSNDPSQDGSKPSQSAQRLHQRILKAVRHRQSQGEPPFTDVFIMSHGWHRNFFGAVAAYDRLVGRFTLLRHSQRLPLLRPTREATEQQEADKQEQADKNFHPLFICLHWHSDPGQDRWDDAQGRRHKDSFLDNAKRMFTYPVGGYASFLRDFECLFELMSQMSSPGKDAFSDKEIEDRAPRITQCLLAKNADGDDIYQLQAAPKASLADKIAVLWTCYYEAEPRGVLTDQNVEPRPYLSIRAALTNLLGFFVSVVGITVIAGFVLPKILPKSSGGFSVVPWFQSILTASTTEGSGFVTRNWREFSAWVVSLPHQLVVWLANLPHQLIALLFRWEFWGFVLALAALWRAAYYKQIHERKRWLLTVGDLKDTRGLIRKLAAQDTKTQDPLSSHLMSQFSDDLQQRLRSYDASKPPSTALREALVNELNLLVEGKSLYTKERFPEPSPAETPSAEAFPSETRRLIQQNPQGLDLIRLNRSLLKHAYKQEFESKDLIPAAKTWPASVIGPCWIFAQAICLVPALIYLFFSYLFGQTIARFRDSSSKGGKSMVLPGFERLGYRGKRRDPKRDTRHGRFSGLYPFIAVARFPAELASLAVAEDSRVASWVLSLNAVLAFFDMQDRGIHSGVHAAGELKPVITALKEDNPNLRIHLLGHSFGGLVMCNVARELVYDPEFNGQIHSLCLIQAALSNSWFEWEEPMLKKVRLIANIYSRYDSANGFYYPMTNQGRCAAGFVGLCDVEKTRVERAAEPDYFKPISRGRYASLVRPPSLGIALQDTATAVNLDASRLIFGGTVASGGGHSLIYKDDVVHLIWAALRLTWEDDLLALSLNTPPPPPASPPPPPASPTPQIAANTSGTGPEIIEHPT